MRENQNQSCELEERDVPKYLKEMEKRCIPGKRQAAGFRALLATVEVFVIVPGVVRHIAALCTGRIYEGSGSILLFAGAAAIWMLVLWKIQWLVMERERKKIVKAALEAEGDERGTECSKENMQEELLEEEEQYCISFRAKQPVGKWTALSVDMYREMLYPTCRILGVSAYYIMGAALTIYLETKYHPGLRIFVLCLEIFGFSMLFQQLLMYPGLFFLYARRKRKKRTKQLVVSKDRFSMKDEKHTTEWQMKDIYVLERKNQVLQIEHQGKEILLLLTEMQPKEQEKLKQILRRYAGNGYERQTVQPGKVRWEVLKFMAAVLAAVLIGNVTESLAESPEYRRLTPKNNAEALLEALSDEANRQEQDGALNQEAPESKEGVMPNGTVVELAADKEELKLNLNGSMLYEYYVTEDTGSTSRFWIDGDGMLFGASANQNGELGLGDREERITAKGYYREMEIAENIVHISLGKEFAAYIDEEKNLWVSGNVPGIGLTVQKTVMMNQVDFVSCSEEGMIILKSDGTVWAAGILRNAGDTLEYPQLTEVMKNARYVAAGKHTFAVIQEDDTLWLWGDNSMQQCGISNITLPFLSEPEKVMEDVRMVWLDALRVNSHISQPYLQDTDWYDKNRTYIQKQDRSMYVCGKDISDGVFAKLKVEQE